MAKSTVSSKYDWANRLTKKTFKMVKGKDFDLEVPSMVKAIRNAACFAGASCSIAIDGNTITTKMLRGPTPSKAKSYTPSNKPAAKKKKSKAKSAKKKPVKKKPVPKKKPAKKTKNKK